MQHILQMIINMRVYWNILLSIIYYTARSRKLLRIALPLQYHSKPVNWFRQTLSRKSNKKKKRLFSFSILITLSDIRKLRLVLSLAESF